MTKREASFELGMLKNSEDPYALLAAARQDGPIQRSGGSWMIFGHAEATQLLRSSSTRSGFIADGYRGRLPPGAAREEMANRVNFLDPPRHGRVRGLIGKAFTPRRTSELRPFVKNITRGLLEPLPTDQHVDLIHDYAHEVPSLVISELLGVPIEHRDRLTDLSEKVSRLLGTGIEGDELQNALEAAEEMHETLRGLIDERRQHPEDDLLSALLAAEEADERLTESELLSLAATLYSAGHRTTRDLFSNGLAEMLSHRALIDATHRGELPIEAVVEEFLRFETPTHLIARMLSEPVEIAGQTISANEPITVLLAAANRDPEAYQDAHLFDPWRWTQPVAPPAPLSFALGAHFCLGASLARLETAVMLETLFEIFPQVRPGEASLHWKHTGVFRGLESLPVVLGPRA
jgi:pimeloyl-[acyl-carrier protein] synthase